MGNQPIDHGWSWMCCLGASVSMFFFIGMLRSIGILLVDVIIRFETSSAMASLLLGLLGFGVSISAPIGTAVGARYDSYRSVIIWGALLAVIATVVTAFATNIVYVVLVYGIFGGIGYGVIAGPGIVTVSMYFDKRRSLANGLATAGGSVGQLVIPLLLRTLLDTYSFQGGMMIFAACVLHVVPAALLLRPLSFYNRKSRSSGKALVPRKSVDMENGRTSAVENGKNGHTKLDNDITPTDNGINGLNGHSKGKVKEENGINGHTKENGDTGDMNGHHDIDDANGRVPKDKYALLTQSGDHEPCHNDDTHQTQYFKQRKRTFSATSGRSISSNHEFKRKVSVYSSHMSLAVLPPAGQLPEVPKHAPWSQVFSKTICCCCIKTPENVVPLVTWKLFKNKVFCLYLLGVCLGNSGYLNALLFLPPYAEEVQVSQTTAAIMMSAVGIADLISRVLGGWFGDLGIVKRHNQLAYTLMLTGISTMICTFFASFTSLVVMLAILGLLGGFYLSLMAVVLVDLMGMEHLSAGFGLTIMMQGVTNIFLPTGLGLIRDLTGSYQVPFIICGAMMFVGGLTFVLQPFLVAHENKKKMALEAISTHEEELQDFETNI